LLSNFSRPHYAYLQNASLPVGP